MPVEYGNIYFPSSDYYTDKFDILNGSILVTPVQDGADVSFDVTLYEYDEDSDTFTQLHSGRIDRVFLNVNAADVTFQVYRYDGGYAIITEWKDPVPGSNTYSRIIKVVNVTDIYVLRDRQFSNVVDVRFITDIVTIGNEENISKLKYITVAPFGSNVYALDTYYKKLKRYSLTKRKLFEFYGDSAMIGAFLVDSNIDNPIRFAISPGAVLLYATGIVSTPLGKKEVIQTEYISGDIGGKYITDRHFFNYALDSNRTFISDNQFLYCIYNAKDPSNATRIMTCIDTYSMTGGLYSRMLIPHIDGTVNTTTKTYATTYIDGYGAILSIHDTTVAPGTAAIYRLKGDKHDLIMRMDNVAPIIDITTVGKFLVTKHSDGTYNKFNVYTDQSLIKHVRYYPSGTGTLKNGRAIGADAVSIIIYTGGYLKYDVIFTTGDVTPVGSATASVAIVDDGNNIVFTDTIDVVPGMRYHMSGFVPMAPGNTTVAVSSNLGLYIEDFSAYDIENIPFTNVTSLYGQLGTEDIPPYIYTDYVEVDAMDLSHAVSLMDNGILLDRDLGSGYYALAYTENNVHLFTLDGDRLVSDNPIALNATTFTIDVDDIVVPGKKPMQIDKLDLDVPTSGNYDAITTRISTGSKNSPDPDTPFTKLVVEVPGGTVTPGPDEVAFTYRVDTTEGYGFYDDIGGAPGRSLVFMSQNGQGLGPNFREGICALAYKHILASSEVLTIRGRFTQPAITFNDHDNGEMEIFIGRAETDTGGWTQAEMRGAIDPLVGAAFHPGPELFSLAMFGYRFSWPRNVSLGITPEAHFVITINRNEGWMYGAMWLVPGYLDYSYRFSNINIVGKYVTDMFSPFDVSRQGITNHMIMLKSPVPRNIYDKTHLSVFGLIKNTFSNATMQQQNSMNMPALRDLRFIAE